MQDYNNKLKDLRIKIDTLDTQILECLSQRSHYVAEVGEIKKNTAIKIALAREAQMMRSLLSRDLPCLYDKRYILRIWREMICASLSLEGDLSFSIYQNVSSPEQFPALKELVQEHFSVYLPIKSFNKEHHVYQEATTSTFAFVPLQGKWWPALINQSDVKIALKLPFTQYNQHQNSHQCYGVSKASIEPSGKDVSVFAAKTLPKNHPGIKIIDQQEGMHLFEVDGFVESLEGCYYMGSFPIL